MPTETAINYHNQLSALKNNDEKALRLLYQNNFPKAEKYILANNGTSDEAKDIFQEAFVALWRNIQLNRFQPQHEASLDAYLFQIAKNKWLDHLRSLKRNAMAPLTDESNGIGEVEELAEQEMIASIKQNFRRLGDVCREALLRFYYHRQSMQVIAEAMKWTEATARNNKYRCLQQLRKLVNPKNPDHE